MSLPDDVIPLLRDEAYVHLCRDALKGAIESVATQKQELSEVREAYGIASGTGEAAASVASMRDLLESEAALETSLAALEAIENCLTPAIRERLGNYLARASESYRRGAKIAASISAWDQLLDTYGERLLALARNIKSVSMSFAGAAGAARSAFGERAQALAELRMSADNLDRTAFQIESLARTVAMFAAGSPYENAVLPELPIKGVVEWVDNLGLRHERDVLAALQDMEHDVRTLVAKKLAYFHGKAASTYESIGVVNNHELEGYWQVLRSHALAHYVQDRDVDEVLSELHERYLVGEVEARQNTF